MKWLLLVKDQRTLAVLLMGSVLICVAIRLFDSRRQESHHAEALTYRFLVDPNIASVPELAQLPGIGPKLAEAIIQYRETIGNFQTNADMQKVRGIGAKKTEAMSPYLIFD